MLDKIGGFKAGNRRQFGLLFALAHPPISIDVSLTSLQKLINYDPLFDVSTPAFSNCSWSLLGLRPVAPITASTVRDNACVWIV